MASEREPAFLLSNKYDPASDSPSKFRQAYHQLVTHRDDLRNQCDAKERKRAGIKQAESQSYGRKPSIKHSELTAAAVPKIQGSRFSNLADNDDGSTTSPPTKHKRAARLPNARLQNFSNEERKQEVANIKRDIQLLKEKKEETRDAAATESKEKRAQEKVKKKGKQDEAKKEDQNEASEIELGQGWETVKRIVKR